MRSVAITIVYVMNGVTIMNKDVNESQKMSPKRKGILTALSALFLILGIIYGIYWLFWGRYLIKTKDAYVNGNQVQLMSQVSGTVTAMYTDDTHFVVQGQPLVILDKTDTLVALQKARANLAQTVRQVRENYENAYQLQASLRLRRADLLQAKQDLQRRQGLVAFGALSNETLQHYTTAVQTAQAEYDFTSHQLAAAQGMVVNTQLYRHPLVELAKNNFRRAYLNWVRTIIFAPATGYVAKRTVQVGQQISTNTPLMAIIPLDQIWVDANYKETQLPRLRIGQPVTLDADANDFTYHGRIVGFTPGTGNAFAILPPQNASGNWIKIVQRLAVRIALDPKEIRHHPLQIGLSMNVKTHTQNLKGKILSTQIENKPLYSTWVYNNQLRDANREMMAILKANAPNIRFKSNTHEVNHGRTNHRC
jgi:membrane fusion protein, multidrug efflux system